MSALEGLAAIAPPASAPTVIRPIATMLEQFIGHLPVRAASDIRAPAPGTNEVIAESVPGRGEREEATKARQWPGPPRERGSPTRNEMRDWCVIRVFPPWRSSSARGRTILNVLPLPSSLSSSISPPCTSTAQRAMQSPSPAPPASRARRVEAVERLEDGFAVLG